VKLSGLNNLGLSGLQKQSAKPSSGKGGAKSSFEDVLGKAKQDTAEFQKPSLKKPLEGKSQEADPGKAEAASVESDALPLQPAPPALNGPINERIVTGKPVAEPALVPTGAKEAPSMPQDEGIDSLTRRVVWNDFLRKMKDDLGVSAEDVLSAFASLSDEELAEPPQETVNTVVAALGLSAEQSQMAKNYFTELVNKTKSSSMGEELGKSQRQINLTLMSQREAQRKSLNRSIDQLSSNFFMKNPQGPQAALTQAQVQQMQAAGDEKQKAAAPAGLEMIEVAAPSAAAVPGMAVSAPPADFPAASAAPAADIMAKAAPMEAPAAAPMDAVAPKVKAEPKNTIDEMVRQFLSPQAKIETLKAGEMSAAPAVAAQAGAAPAAGADTAAQTAAAAGSMSAGSLKGMLEDLSSSLDSDGDDEYSSDASYLTAGLAGEHKIANLNGPSPEFQAELNKAAKEPMSVPDLVDKAQIMVHEGGGEMKVTLTPEGMGEVAMKVSVNEGKVQVQMITESDEAKKLIERQLGELKSSLHSNHLSLDTIKIDTATNLGKQLEQQYQDAQRQATQTAWEQFRQDNQGWRRSFFETPSAKLYKGQGEAPRDVQAPSSVNASNRKNANRRLDLVA
jgi:flagellar hook-length control protein FliK